MAIKVPKRVLVVPAHSGESVRQALAQHFLSDREITVQIERRRDERRANVNRRQAGLAEPLHERRKIRSVDGLRVAERRAELEPVEGFELPRRFRRKADEIALMRRNELPPAKLRENEGTRIALRAQLGDFDALLALHVHYFERLLVWLSIETRNSPQVEDLAQETFAKALEALSTWERRSGSRFGPWLFRIASNELGMHRRAAKRVRLNEAHELDALSEERQLQGRGAEPSELVSALGWVSDSDLFVLLRLLSEEQRRALTLRFHLGYEIEEVAEALGKRPDAVEKLIQRALRFLEARLTATRGTGAVRRRGNGMLTRIKPLPVLGGRRFALFR